MSKYRELKKSKKIAKAAKVDEISESGPDISKAEDKAFKNNKPVLRDESLDSAEKNMLAEDARDDAQL